MEDGAPWVEIGRVTGTTADAERVDDGAVVERREFVGQRDAETTHRRAL